MNGRQRTVFLTGAEAVELRETDVPKVHAGEILVRISAATTCGTDVKVFRRGGHPRMLRVPTPFGHEMSGTIAEVGPGVTQWHPGDDVVIANSASCGHCEACRNGRENLCSNLEYLNGAFSEYIIVPRAFVEHSTYLRPAGLDDSIAALTEPLACVVHGFDVLNLGRSRDVVIFGAGPIGLLFVNALAVHGHRVVVIDPHAPRLHTATALGAAATLEARAGSDTSFFVRTLAASPSGFEVAIEATGSTDGWTAAIESVATGGSVLLFGGCAVGTTVELDTHRLHYSELAIRGAYHHTPATFARALELLAGGELKPDLLLSAEQPLEGTEAALRSMMAKETLKVVIRP